MPTKQAYNLPEEDQEAADYYYYQNQPLKVHQHKIFWPYLILSLVILIAGGRYIYLNMFEGVVPNLPDWIKAEIDNTNTSVQQELVALRDKDTDQDGLNDYSEVYQYNTSMFLADTDSDGVPDSDEVKAGTDPLCPGQENCSLLRLITPETKVSDVVQDAVTDQDLTLEQAALQEMRKFLVENGVSQAEVDLLSDDDLRVIFATVEASNLAENNNWTEETSATEVRAFLLSQSGADTAAINQMSEQELINIRDRIILEQ